MAVDKLFEQDFFVSLAPLSRLLFYELSARADGELLKKSKLKTIIKKVGCEMKNYEEIKNIGLVLETENDIYIINKLSIYSFLIPTLRYKGLIYNVNMDYITNVGNSTDVSNCFVNGNALNNTTNVSNNVSNNKYIEECFEKTWKLVVNKKSKVYSQKCYVTKLKKCKTREEIHKKAKYILTEYLKSVKEWKEQNREKQYIPMFSSWLNKNIDDSIIK